MRPRGPRPDALQSVTVLEILAAHDPQHGKRVCRSRIWRLPHGSDSTTAP